MRFSHATASIALFAATAVAADQRLRGSASADSQVKAIHQEKQQDQKEVTTGHRHLQSCLSTSGDFSLSYVGSCTEADILPQITAHMSTVPACSTSNAADELAVLLGGADLTTYCSDARSNADEVPFVEAITNDEQAIREYFDGGYDFNNFPLDADTTARILAVPSSSLTIAWPSADVTDNFEGCELGVATCCWVDDADSGESPASNTDVCYADYARAPRPAHVANGFAVYDKNGLGDNAEGDVYCEGFAWDTTSSSDVNGAYKGNLLFEVAMKRNLAGKNYVRNVPGAPLCGCVEKMPVVTDAACTELTQVDETWQLEVSSGVFGISLEGVDLSYDDCGSSLADKYKMLHDGTATEGDIDTYLVGDGQCEPAIDAFLADKGLKRSTIEILKVSPHPGRHAVSLHVSAPLAESAADVENFELSDSTGQLLTLTGATLSSNKQTITLATSEQTFGTEYTLKVVGRVSKAIATMVIVPLNSEYTFYPTSYGYEDNVPESVNYTLAYSLEIPNNAAWSNTNPPYTYGTEPFTTFDRVAYFMELESPEHQHQWIWVSMPAFTANPAMIGVPTRPTGAVYQESVEGANVVTNQHDIAPEGSLSDQVANLEFWPTSYGRSNAAGVAGADGNTFDFGDQRSTGGGYGSMQIHIASLGTTLFALNNWGNSGSKPVDLGIGNQGEDAGDNPDWTFANNAGDYTLKKLQVLVLATASPDLTALAPTSHAATVDDAVGYRMVYDLDIPDKASYGSVQPAYNADYHLFQSPFTRIAYYVELESVEYGLEWIWVSMDAFTTDASKIGVPTFASGAIWQQALTGMNVASNQAGMSGTDLAGNIEFWPNNYGRGNAKGVTGASGSVYDFGDERSSGGNYGSMQVHSASLPEETIFALNNFNRGANPCVGIGTQPHSEPDWTFSDNALIYTKKTIQVFVK